MTTTIWILKAIIALIFTFTGIYKIFLPKTKLIAKGMKGLTDLDEDQIRVVGLLEILGVGGLILPALLNLYPFISAISATCLGLTMVIAGWINSRLKLTIIPNIVIFIICGLITFLELKSF
jgi:uncharacterized protein YjeT (DUF2065 family)